MRHFPASSSSTVAGETVSIVDIDANDDEKDLDSVAGALTQSFEEEEVDEEEEEEEPSLSLSVSLLPQTRLAPSRSTEDDVTA